MSRVYLAGAGLPVSLLALVTVGLILSFGP